MRNAVLAEFLVWRAVWERLTSIPELRFPVPVPDTRRDSDHDASADALSEAEAEASSEALALVGVRADPGGCCAG
jgi:hypothetical protein